jgi:hypothetical protein
MAIYNLKSALDDYRITKFDRDLNVEASYLIIANEGRVECECPAGERPTCRHRQMLPHLLPIVDTSWFWDFERAVVVDANGIPKPYVDEANQISAEEISAATSPAKSWRRI